jgi:hypothetical protein
LEGRVAQLGERLVRNEEAAGSIPATSTISEAVTNDQVVKVFVKYLDDHPEELHRVAALLLSEALHSAFPCKE